MKAIQRLVIASLIGVLTVSMVGCGSNTDTGDKATTSSTSASADASASDDSSASGTDATSAEEVKLDDFDEPALIINGQEISSLWYNAVMANATSQVEEASKSDVTASMREQLINLVVMGQYYTDTATDVEKEELNKEVQEQYEATGLSGKDYFVEQGLLTSADATDEEVMQAYEKYLVANGLTPNTQKQDIYISLAASKGQQKMLDEIEVTEEDEKKWYDAQLLEQRELFSTSPSEFDTMMSQETPLVVTAPEGYGYVKHVLIKLDDTKTEELATLQTELDGYAQEVATNLSQANPDAAKTKELETKMTETRAKISQLYKDSIETKANEVLTKAKAGDDFDALIVEYGEDPGMEVEPAKTKGYLVGPGTSMVQPFLTASENLQNVGDISDLVYSQFGIHIIKKVGTVSESDFAFDKIKDTTAKEGARLEKASTEIQTKVEELAKDATIEDKTSTDTTQN